MTDEETKLLCRKYFETAAPMLAKMVTLSNAGGVAATITVIGATAKNGCIWQILAVPLALFTLGVCLAILYVMGTVFRLADVAEENLEIPEKIKLIGETGFVLISGFGSVLCFFIGSLAGILLIVFS